MTTVFIGGSRQISHLNDEIRPKLAEIVERRLPVLVGDANGADRAIQAQLAKWHYAHVTVYFVGSAPRNNLSDWPLLRIATPKGVKGFAYYSVKDRRMAADADCGLMLWDGESRGTLANVEDLLQQQKPVAVYVSKEGRFVNAWTLSDVEALGTFAHNNSIADATQAELSLGMPRKRVRARRHRSA